MKARRCARTAFAAALAIAGAAATAVPALAATAAPQGSAAPCPSLLIVNLCNPLATPYPSTTPAPPPPPAPTAPPAAPHAAAPAPASHPAPAAAAGGSDTGSLPNGTGSYVQMPAFSDNPALIDQVASIAAHPAAAAAPDLQHFDFLTRAGALPGAPARGGGPLAAPATIAAAIAVGILALLTLACRRLGWGMDLALLRTGLRRLLPHPRLAPPERALFAALGLLVTAATVGTTFAVGQANAAAAHHAGPAGVALRGARSTPLAAVAAAASPAAGAPWGQLLTIERGLVAQHQELASQETLISQFNQVLSGDVKGNSLLGSRLAGRLGDLPQLITAHQSTLDAYNSSLQQEYSFYVSAAKSTATQDALVGAASETGLPAAISAVSYDLRVVQTQLSQETAVATAEAKAGIDGTLQAVGQLLSGLGGARLLAPLSGTVTQGFGPTSLAMEPPVTYDGRFYPHFHTGLDIAGPMDSPVHAAAAGTVILTAWSPAGYGNYVVISHGNGIVTLYGHLDRVVVSTGQSVSQGQVIGLEGSTGNSTGPHLHFEVRLNNVIVDPQQYLAGQVR